MHRRTRGAPNLILATLALLISANTWAVVLFSNGPAVSDSDHCDSGPDGCGITDGGRWTVYDDFRLSDRSFVTGFEYSDYFRNTQNSSYADPSTYINTFWTIYAGNPSNGGLLQASGTAIAAVTNGAASSYLFTVTGLGLNLMPGTYWLGISNTVSAGPIVTTFAKTGVFPLPGGAYQSDGYGYFPTYQRAFNVNGALVPVPAATWLLGSALGTLGWLRRRAR